MYNCNLPVCSQGIIPQLISSSSIKVSLRPFSVSLVKYHSISVLLSNFFFYIYQNPIKHTGSFKIIVLMQSVFPSSRDDLGKSVLYIFLIQIKKNRNTYNKIENIHYTGYASKMYEMAHLG